MVASVGQETTLRARRRCLFAEAADLAMLEMCNFHDSLHVKVRPTTLKDKLAGRVRSQNAR